MCWMKRDMAQAPRGPPSSSYSLEILGYHLVPLCLSFPICKMGSVVVTCPWGCAGPSRLAGGPGVPLMGCGSWCLGAPGLAEFLRAGLECLGLFRGQTS